MEKGEFHSLLRQMLAEKITPQGQKRPTEGNSEVHDHLAANLNFYWQAPETLNFSGRGLQKYPRTQRPTRPKQKVNNSTLTEVHKLKPMNKESQCISLSRLEPRENSAAQTLLRLGASELKDGVSLFLLKKAHRRLAKQLHPDAGTKSLADQFIELQGAYEILRRALPKYMSSDSVYGNGSASEPASQRPDAA